MRILSGERKGFSLKGPYIKNVRPVMDKVKDSMFSLLIPFQIRGAKVIDIFAGTGSVGLEAVSRGAKKCYFIEANRRMAHNITDNIQLLKYEDKCRVINKDFRIALRTLKKQEENFDFVFSDPPYNLGLVKEFLDMLEKFNILSKDGILIMEIDRDEIPKELQNFEIVKHKEYGRTNIFMFKIKL